jgi:hypothetical protein
MSDSQRANASTLNLDLSGIDDPTQLAQSIEQFYKNDTQVKTALAKNWERNQLMLDGQQWLQYEQNTQSGGMWKPIQVNKENEYIPRPVTNIMYDAYQTLKGYLLKTKPRITVRPNTMTHKDKSAAKLATLVSESNYERLGEDENYEYAASVLVGFGTVFKKSYWDISYVNQAEVPRMEEIPQTDPMTGQVVGSQLMPAVDEFGQPIMDLVPIGDVNTDVIEPYRIALDPLAMSLNKTRWIMEYSIQPLDWIKTTYGKEGEGYIPGAVDELKPETSLNNSMRRFFQLKSSSGVRNGGLISNVGGSAEYVENTAVVKEYYERPSSNYPKGRLVVVANGITLYVGPSPCEGPELGDWHPYSECRWELVPGRFWAKSPLDDGAEIQKKLNSIDSTIILTRKTMAIPQKLIPLGIGVEPGSWTGRPGLEKFYRADGSGTKPEVMPSSGVHESVFMEREKTLEDFKSVTGAIDILKGDRPPGVTAASALSMLYEVGTGKLFPVLGRWKRFIESDQKKQLRLIASKYQEPRPEFIRMLMMRNQELSEQEINNFIGSDLYDNCNVVIEAGSNIPKLQAAEQALLLEVSATGALSLEMPANRSEFLQRLGISGFDNDVGPDTRRAEWENDLLHDLETNPDNKPVVLVTDNHAIHLEVHGNMTKEPRFMSMPLAVQQAVFMHIQEHDMMQQQAQQQQMIQAAMTGQPPQEQSTGQEPQELKEAGNGMTSKQRDALFSDALVPGQVKGNGNMRGPGQG